MLIGSDHNTSGQAAPGEIAALPALSAQLAAALSDPDASDVRWDLADAIAASIPATPEEAIVVVSLLTNQDIGLDAGQTEVHLTAARSLEAGLRAMAANADNSIAAMDDEIAGIGAEAATAPPEALIAGAAERAGITVEQARACYDTFMAPLSAMERVAS
ncbi:hypothetical protein FBZ83_10116 [Azospirillum brasilense]|uniref:Uncharacterized protein n=1 Tax=Azospirillum brasilense TaxID=192 RepID=A0A560CQM7_AZOBR|nr:hypothetical protein [Azospirillum brasilense]TWA87154.1 hypothetical protein FBZ83_10116 [Azospirillum brasilense]